MGLGCEEQDRATPRRALIKAAGGLDLPAIRKALDGAASDPNAKKDLLAVEYNDGTWGACLNEAALHAAILALPRRGADDDRKRRWVAVLDLLLEHGADPNAVRDDYDWRGCGVSQSAFEMVLERGAMEDARLLRMFLKGGADPNHASKSRIHSMRTDGFATQTPLHTVVSAGAAIDCAAELLRAGAEVDARRVTKESNERGYGQDLSETALHIAAQNGSLEWCSLLLGKGADVDAEQRHLHIQELDVESPTDDPRDERFVPSVRLVPVRQRALHIAIANNNPDLVRLLVLHKADKSAPYVFGGEEKTAEELCAEQQVDEESKRKLLDALGAEWSTEMQKFYPKSFRDSVRATLLTAKRQQWPMDTENTLSDIFTYAADIKETKKRKLPGLKAENPCDNSLKVSGEGDQKKKAA